MAAEPDHFCLICTTCNGGAKAKEIRAALVPDLPQGYAVRAVDCMAGCNRPTTVGFQADGKASYLFGDIGDAADFSALAEFAAQYQQSASGWTSATERPAALSTKTLARMPGPRTKAAT